MGSRKGMALPLDADGRSPMNEREKENIPEDGVEEIFLNALDYESGPARESFLRTSCAGKAGLRAAVDAMLRDHEGATTLFRDTARECVGAKDDLVNDVVKSTAPVGPYRIIRLLGEGGGGTVYEAEQETPIHRVVALKILKPGTDARRFLALFEAERQTLALMEHPNIARVLDAGTTADDRSYFVMDLVHGVKITEYCARNALPIAERLHLMRQVCSAVQHAHNKGIIHRDLKPSNILVTNVDGVAIPKVIDFGIARAVVRPVQDCGDSAPANQWIGTPAYMSPEQFADAADIDTRSDVYSLGVVMYELVAGKPPFDDGLLTDAGPEEIRRKISERTPPRLASHGRRDNQGPVGELDCIVFKAMERDREKRYPTVQALSADIGRLLRGDPVEAHPPSHIYRMRKLVLRNRLASATITAAVIALVAGCTTSTLLYLRAKAAEREQTRLRAYSEEREHVTKAAILIMQGRISEADMEVRKMGGILTQPSLEATNVFRELAVWSAINGDWKTSADRWLALSRVNRFDDSDMTDHATRDLLPIAPTLVTIGDLKRYHEFQQLLIDRLGKTTNPVAAEHVLKLCLQKPASPALLTELAYVAGVAESSMTGDIGTPPKITLEAWRCLALGLWNYRNGRYAQAIQWCDRTLLWKDENLARKTQAIIIRAMALRATGDYELAKTDLNEARDIYARRFSQPHELNSEGSWYDWLNANILFDEVGSMP
jgi:eukaryotic-like serine/threonine-protein kinase